MCGDKLGLAFNAVTGVRNLSPALQAFAKAASDIIDPHEKLQKLVDQTYIRALMSGDDDTVIAGIRVNLAGRQEGDGLTPAARFVRNMLNQMMIDQVTEDIMRLKEIQRELKEVRAEIQAIEEKYLTEEEMALQPGETEAEKIERIRKILEAKVANGEMTQAEFDAWKRAREREAALQAEADAIIENIVDNDQAMAAFHVMQEKDRELAERMSSIESRVDQNALLIKRLGEIRKMNSGDASTALDVLLVENPHLDISIPEDATAEEALEIVKAAVGEDNADLSREALEVTAEQEANEAAQAELTVASDIDRTQALGFSESLADVSSSFGGDKDGYSLASVLPAMDN